MRKLVQLDYAAMERTGGLCAVAGQRPRWVRIFSITSGCSMNAMIRIAPAHRGHTRGSTSYTCLINRAQARFETDGAISLNSSIRHFLTGLHIEPLMGSVHDLLCLINVSFWYSSKAIFSSCWVFMTMGPYQATGSLIGFPEINKNRKGVSLVVTKT